jgi:hypothetical protein
MLRGRGGCYKHAFYGIESHRCMEATPSLACANKCVFCWRHHSNPVATSWKWDMDPPQQIVEQALAQVRVCGGGGEGGGGALMLGGKPGRWQMVDDGGLCGRPHMCKSLVHAAVELGCALCCRAAAAQLRLPNPYPPLPPLQHVAMVKEYSGVPGVLPVRLAEGYQVGGAGAGVGAGQGRAAAPGARSPACGRGPPAGPGV